MKAVAIYGLAVMGIMQYSGGGDSSSHAVRAEIRSMPNKDSAIAVETYKLVQNLDRIEYIKAAKQ